MQFPRRLPRTASEDGMLPLINVVFLLLIFFMLAGRLAASDPLPVMPPESQTAAPAGVRAVAVSQEAVVLLAADGRLALDGAVLRPADLTVELSRRLQEQPGLRVTLKADSAAQAAAVVDLMDRLRDAGVTELELFAQSPQAASQMSKPER